MKTISGIILMILGIVFGLWLGLWVMLIGGIIDAVELFKGTIELTGMNVAITICKIVLAEVVGVIAFLVLFAPGLSLVRN